MSPSAASACQLWINAAFQADLETAGLTDFDTLLRVGDPTALNKRGLARWRERVEVSLATARGSRRLFLKRYRRPPVAEQLRRWFRGASSIAELELSGIQQVRSLGIAVPEAVACGVRRAGWREAASLLMTAELPGTSLERWIPEQLAKGPLPRALQRSLSETLARLVARLHGGGVVHRDLYLAHVFLTGGPPWSLALIDLHRVFRPRRWRRTRWIVKDLAALNHSTPTVAATRADRMRWLRHYCGVSRLGPPERRLAWAVVRKTRRIARHSARHGL